MGNWMVHGMTQASEQELSKLQARVPRKPGNCFLRASSSLSRGLEGLNSSTSTVSSEGDYVPVGKMPDRFFHCDRVQKYRHGIESLPLPVILVSNVDELALYEFSWALVTCPGFTLY